MGRITRLHLSHARRPEQTQTKAAPSTTVREASEQNVPLVAGTGFEAVPSPRLLDTVPISVHLKLFGFGTQRAVHAALGIREGVAKGEIGRKYRDRPGSRVFIRSPPEPRDATSFPRAATANMGWNKNQFSEIQRYGGGLCEGVQTPGRAVYEDNKKRQRSRCLGRRSVLPRRRRLSLTGGGAGRRAARAGGRGGGGPGGGM